MIKQSFPGLCWVFETFFRSLESSAFTVKVKLHNWELVPQRTETWHLHVLCWVSRGISQSCAVAVQIRALQVCYCRIKIYSDKSPDVLVSVHMFMINFLVLWLQLSGCCSTLYSMQQLKSFTCVICPRTNSCSHKIWEENFKLNVYFFHYGLMECSVIDGDVDYLQWNLTGFTQFCHLYGLLKASTS